MAEVAFTANLARHRATPRVTVAGANMREVLDRVFADDPMLRSYILDDQGRLRKHVNIFLDSEMITDRKTLSDPVSADAQVYIMQALSGG